MSDIMVIEKPEWISYDEIHEVLFDAHASNREKGMVMSTVLLSGDELSKRIGKEGKCFVALDGEKLVGTASYRVCDRNRWYIKGKVLDYILLGVLPEYKGKHISSMLYQKIEEQAITKGYSVIELDTAEGNTLIQEINKKQGFRHVSYFASKSKHYSVVMVKWLNGSPFSEKYCMLRFKIKRFLIRLRYKPGHIKRFGI